MRRDRLHPAWLAWLVCLAPAMGAQAQDDGVTEDEEMPLDEAEPDDGDSPEGEVPTEATTSVTIDDRQAELRREQEAMEAEDRAEAPPPDLPDDEPAELSHLYQVGIRVGVGFPAFFGLRYGSGPPCDRPERTFCYFLGSGFIDADLSFGITDDLEITALGRFGFAPTEPTENAQLVFGLGIRSLLMPRDVVKLFLGARVILDATQAGALSTRDFDWSPVDVGVRGEFGVQVDIIRWLGLYAQIGVNILFLRSFGVWGDFSGGAQARFP
ncbi:MAG: hypothetical protein AB7S26_31275 [Sandaracinaceae bacterium]